MDSLTPAARSANMSRIRSTATKPELHLAQLLRRLKVRYTQATSALPGKPDFILTASHQAILVHGCFWHLHKGCNEGRVPSSNVAYWGPKLARNVRRDARISRALRRLGYGVITVWECQLRDDPAKVQKRLQRLAVTAS